MPTDPSKYAENQFLRATAGRIPLMDEVLAYTAPRLNSAAVEDPAFDGVLDLFTPAHAAWNQGMTMVANTVAAVPAATYAVTDKLASLTRKPDADTNSPIEAWDNVIRGVYAFQGPAYVNLLPRGRETLTKGTIEEQIDAIEAFGVRLAEQTGKAPLIALAPAVKAFAAAARALRNEQSAKMAAMEQARQRQEALRVRCAIVLYRAIGFAMWQWGETPDRVDTLFNVTLLRGPAITVPAPPADTTWNPATRTLSTSALADGASRVEAWRLAPGGAPEMIATSGPDEPAAVVPETIVFQPGVTYQLWLESLNSKGSSGPGPKQVWTAPAANGAGN